ncbi:hypothetical protein [Speluncibacter jeojiensis]|uniref:Uncharacterized protein n=1 Tax=Speluncibacter jeojiensis TaxID=2710754 RepID=A0A9X4RDI2_9ACTN|nr:hypothetical protein [Corynebacteriales bacterium D3-21]
MKRIEPRMSAEELPDGSEELPAIEWVPQWPIEISDRCVATQVILAALGVLFLGVAVMGAVEGQTGMVIGFGAMLLVVAGTSGMTFAGSGFRARRLSRRIGQYADDVHGRGVLIPSSRTALRLIVGVVGATAVAAITAAVVRYTGWGESLLPFAHDSHAGAAVAGIVGGIALVLTLILATARSDADLTLYPSGMRRRTHGRVLWWNRRSESFIAWDDIASIGPRMDVADPVITLQLASRCVNIDVDDLVTEPNTLLALLRLLGESPHRRDLLARADARLMLTSPPVGERIRLARRARRDRRAAK